MLNHSKAAAVAVVLVPLASFMATPAAAQTCTTATISGFVWYDANNNGIQDPGELGIGGALITIDAGEGGITVTADGTGHYTYCLPFVTDSNVTATVPPGFISPSPYDATDDGHDSDGDSLIPGENGEPDQVTTSVPVPPNSVIDFGFWKPNTSSGPGTGTPGYWKTHPEAWPVESIVVGGRTYTKLQAIQWLNDVGSDKSATMFSSLVPAMLNGLIGNTTSCVADEITKANNWMVTNPVGSKVKASSAAWKVGEPWHRTLDNYNNGMLCAPHRD